jgi:hypothetical protein
MDKYTYDSRQALGYTDSIIDIVVSLYGKEVAYMVVKDGQFSTGRLNLSTHVGYPDLDWPERREFEKTILMDADMIITHCRSM